MADDPPPSAPCRPLLLPYELETGLPEELRFTRLFADIFSDDEQIRGAELDCGIAKLRLACAIASGNGGDVSVSSIGVYLPEETVQQIRQHSKQVVNAHRFWIARFATECPYLDVRTRFGEILLLCPKIDLPMGPSRFVSPSLCPSVTPEDTETRQIFESIFLSSGQLTHLDRLLGWHPSFLRVFTETLSYIMRDDGPLPFSWRRYIAIMAASRHDCEYLIDLLEHEFVSDGGDRSWLCGIQNAPLKLQALSEINAIIAHQPWILRKDNIGTLVKGGGSKTAHENLWSVSELVHALVILSTYHALCGLAFGLGVVPEISDTLPMGNVTYHFSEGLGAAEEGGSNRRILEILKAESKSEPSGDVASSFAAADEAVILTSPSQSPYFQNWTSPSPSPSPCSARRDLNETNETETGLRRSRLYIDPQRPMAYENFDCKSNRYTVFHSHEYSWKEHGVPLLNQFYSGVGNLLDTELDLIYDLTYGTMNCENIDTTPYRRALWYYVSRLYGVSYDDYDYRFVNTFLGIPVKSFVKKVACHPESVSYKDFSNMDVKLQVDEKAHLALLASEGRKQCSLLYALYGIMQFMRER